MAKAIALLHLDMPTEGDLHGTTTLFAALDVATGSSRKFLIIRVSRFNSLAPAQPARTLWQ
ncbi:hypothetical protein, partial [Pseudomonas corrugata]|uniref:hypothetical protein n=1 Tax=Pseudomonas corrugata TaxID=47879 RepID=UPI001F522367